MIHREAISIEDYTDEFDVPYLAEFAETFRKYVAKSGVRNRFCLDMPIYFPGELKPVPIFLNQKGTDSYACQAGNYKVTYNCNLSDLKSQVLKGFQFTREWDDEIGNVYFYGIHISAKIFCQLDIDLSFKKIVTGVYRISDNGSLRNMISDDASIPDLCGTYDVEFDGENFEIVLPNISTKYSMRRFFDYIQFICRILEQLPARWLFLFSPCSDFESQHVRFDF